MSVSIKKEKSREILVSVQSRFSISISATTKSESYRSMDFLLMRADGSSGHVINVGINLLAIE